MGRQRKQQADTAAAAMEYYLEALEFAEEAENRILQGKILYNMGCLNFDRMWDDDAIIQFKKALDIFQIEEGKYQWEIYTLYAIADAMMMDANKTDSAKYYYKAALNMAKLHGDYSLQATVLNNMGVAYNESGQVDSANYYLRQALPLTTDDDDRAYLYKNSNDSARYYLYMAEPLLENIDNIYTSASYYLLYYQIEKAAKNDRKALEYFELYSERLLEITEMSDRQTLLELQRKYDSKNRENEHYREKSRLHLIIGLLAAFLFALVIAALAIQKKKAKKQLALEKAEREREELEQKLETLQDLYHKRDDEIRIAFLEKLGALLILDEKFSEKVSVSALPQGVYLLQFHTDKCVIISRFVKE